VIGVYSGADAATAVIAAGIDTEHVIGGNQMGLSESFRCLSVIAQYGGTGPDVGHGQRASELHVPISTDGDRTQYSGCGVCVGI
jgi:hypothetical protein